MPLINRINLSYPGKKFNTIFFALNTLFGLLSALYLFLLPVDPDTKTRFYYSISRLVLILSATAGTLLFAYLVYRSSRNETSTIWLSWLYPKKERLPTIFLALFLFGCFLLGILGLYFSDQLLRLNHDAVLRILPFLLWVVAAIFILTAAWVWIWKPFTLRFTQASLHILLTSILFGTAFLARASITGYGLPYQNVWDEVITYPQAMRMLVQPGLKPYSDVPGYGNTAYGDLLTYITLGGEAAGLLNGFRTQQVSSVAEYVSPPVGVRSVNSAVHPSGIPLQYPRLLLSFLNSFAPILIYIAIFRFLKANHWAAFGGGLAYGILSREVIYYSSYILPDALAATLFVLLIISCWKSIDEIGDGLVSYLVNGLLTGFILSITIRLAAVVFLPFLTFILSKNHKRPITRILSVVIGIVAGFFLTSPYALLDLPGFLVKTTSFAWYHELDISHRLSSVIFYFQGMFLSGFHSGNIDSSVGSIGLGPLVGLLALIGFGWMILHAPRKAVWITIFIVLHLYSISPVVQHYTRHALVFYPLACILAGAGLSWTADWLAVLLNKLSYLWKKFSIRLPSQSSLRQLIAPVAVLLIFLLLSAGQIRLTIRYLNRTRHYQTSQQQAEDFMAAVFRQEDKAGILAELPWVEQELKDHHISFERISRSDSIDSLYARGITYVIGTDRVAGDYGSVGGTIWDGNTFPPEAKVAEFGTGTLEFEGYPAGKLYIFVARLP